jgi:hypothetical protein
MTTDSATTENTATGAAETDPASILSQVRNEFSTALASADANSVQSVQSLQQVHQARLSLLTRTAASLKTQYGADDPRVKAAQSAVTATTATVGRISMVNQQLTTAVPPVPMNGWVLYGRVFDAQAKPLSRYTVFLVDSQNAYQEAYGFTYTEDSGYFLLSHAGPNTKASSHSVTPLFVEIANTKGQPIYLGTTAFQPAPGSATYQNITIPSGAQPIGDPPPAIRSVAIPVRKKGQAAASTKRKTSS